MAITKFSPLRAHTAPRFHHCSCPPTAVVRLPLNHLPLLISLGTMAMSASFQQSGWRASSGGAPHAAPRRRAVLGRAVRPQVQDSSSAQPGGQLRQPELGPSGAADLQAISNGSTNKQPAAAARSNGQPVVTEPQQLPAANGQQQPQQQQELSIQQQQQLSIQQPNSSSSTNGVPVVAAQKQDTGWYYAVGLSAIAALICSVDRAAISVAILPMSEQFGWSDSTKGAINR